MPYIVVQDVISLLKGAAVISWNRGLVNVQILIARKVTSHRPSPIFKNMPSSNHFEKNWCGLYDINILPH